MHNGVSRRKNEVDVAFLTTRLTTIYIYICMIDSDRRPPLKSESTDVIISNHGPILGYSQIGDLSKLSYL